MVRPHESMPHGLNCACLGCRSRAVNLGIDDIDRKQVPVRRRMPVTVTLHTEPLAVAISPVCKLSTCEKVLVKPARGRMPAYCSAAHKKAGQRVEKKETS